MIPTYVYIHMCIMLHVNTIVRVNAFNVRYNERQRVHGNQ